MRKILSVFVALMMLVGIISGCSNTATTPTDPQTNATEDVNNSENNNQSDNEISDSGNTEVKELEALPAGDDRNGRSWKYEDDGLEIVLSAGYCTDNDYVYDITFSATADKNFSDYASFKSEMQNYTDQLKALNDNNIFVSISESDGAIAFASIFDGLEQADRAERIAMAAEVIGITPNGTDTSFHYTELDAELKGAGFEYGA